MPRDSQSRECLRRYGRRPRDRGWPSTRPSARVASLVEQKAAMATSHATNSLAMVPSSLESTPESKSDSLYGVRSHPPTSRGLNRFHGQENGPSDDAGCARHDRACQGAPNSRVTVDLSHLPSRAVGYLSLIQLTCKGSAGNNARSPKFPNCWGQGPGSHLCCPLVRQSIIDPSVC